MPDQRIVCTQCQREKPEKDFFMTKQHERYPVCKPCLTQFIDNNDPNTFMWILEKFNVPYIESVWKDKCEIAYKKNPMKFGSASVIGRYLRDMNMTQYRNETFADTEKWAAKAERIARDTAARIELSSEQEQEEFMNLQAKLDAGEITEAEFNTLNPLNRGLEAPAAEKKYTFNQAPVIDEDSLMDELTPEDRKNLTLKWGMTYKPSEWIRMEDLYNSYAQEYELNIDRKEALKQICKLAVKMDQALECGDTNAYKSLQSSQDALRKSAKFTEVQNKEDSKGYLDSIGELVALCERKKGPIPQIPWPDDYPQDKIDFCIKDMKQYTYNLVTKELGLGNLIESYVEKLEKQQEEEAKKAAMDDDNFILSAEDEEALALTDQEAEDFANYLENQIEEEAMRLAGEL